MDKSTVMVDLQGLSKQGFYDYLYGHVVVLKNYICAEKLYGVQDPHYKHLVTLMSTIVERFCLQYGRASAAEKEAFVTENLDTIYKIYDTFYNKETKRVLLSKDERHDVRSIIDRFYSRICGIRKVDTYFHGIPTRVFQDFVKGVTHFATDTVHDRPSYHRSGSCGPKDADHLERFAIHAGDSKEMIHQKRDAVIRCYVDRYIYDKVYTRILHKQDVNHLLELEAVGRLVGAFADVRVIVHFQGILPNRLSVLVNLLNGTPWYREDYRKYANGRVLAVRADNIAFRTAEQMKYRYKVQTFEAETAWSAALPKAEQGGFAQLIKTLPNSRDRAWSQPPAWLSDARTAAKRDRQTAGGFVVTR